MEDQVRWGDVVISGPFLRSSLWVLPGAKQALNPLMRIWPREIASDDQGNDTESHRLVLHPSVAEGNACVFVMPDALHCSLAVRRFPVTS